MNNAITSSTESRPWQFYLLSDLCADDVWSYSDLEAYERDDYLTTRAEMLAGAGNRYNLAAANQAQRFLRLATPAERSAFKRALRSGRVYVTPTPNQFLCGSLMLSAYPLALEPYRQLCAEVNVGEPLSADAYHMEATTWTNGYVNLLACAGFRSFAKSLLLYQAPWIYALRKLPRLMRLEVAPGRFIFLLLRCGDYTEGSFILQGADEAEQTLRERVIPEHEQWGGDYPINAIPLVGAYGDLAPRSPQLAAMKMRTVRELRSRDTNLLNATFPMFWDQVVRELGVGTAKDAEMLHTVRGDTGSSWEIWMLAAQAEAARFRQAQRDIVSLRVLDAMQPARQTRAARQWLRDSVHEVVGLADHAWNGDAGRDDVKQLNLNIRRRRLTIAEEAIGGLRAENIRHTRWQVGEKLAVVNTLGWKRACRVKLPNAAYALSDSSTGATYGADDAGWITVPAVPAFGARELTLVDAIGSCAQDKCPVWVSRLTMEPYLVIGDKHIAGQGTWHKARACGEWQVGPFTVNAQLMALPYTKGAAELRLTVSGTPPEKPYELCWLFHLPWRKVVWRGESGGGFCSPGAVDRGGDSLLGIRGSVFMAGEGLSAAPVRGNSRLDFALDESGACGLAERTTTWAYGYYDETVTDDHTARAMPQTRVTAGKMYWYLLANAQNHKEALLDQGGTRRWSFRCGLQLVKAAFNDVSLYQFAAGFNHRGEVASSGIVPASSTRWLQVSPEDRMTVLSVSRTVKQGVPVYEVDLYNTAPEATQMTFSGDLFRGRRAHRADMLGRRLKQLRAKSTRLEAHEFARLIVE